jgi:replicative DNA helicase
MTDPRDEDIHDRPPANYEAEQGLLAMILARNETYDQVADFLLPEHFADEAHARIFEVSAELIGQGQVANAVTLKHRFEGDRGLADVGGSSYLAGLQANMVTGANAKDYGQAIRDTFLRRQLIEIGDDAAEQARLGGPGMDPGALIEAVGTELAELGEMGAGEAPGHSLVELMDAWLANVEEARRAGGILGVPTGIELLDDKLGGLHKGTLVVLAGRPGQGKTAMGMNVAQNAARLGRSVLFLSIEMSDEQLAGRLLAGETGVPVDLQLRGKVSDDDLETLAEARRSMHDLRLTIESPRHPTVTACRTKARRVQRRKGLDLVIIDYLQLMVASGRIENRAQEVSVITRELKKLAEDLGVPILLLSQLNRQVESRDDKRPNLADLRDSGSIEQDADVVIFVYREHEYLKNEEPRKKANQKDEDFAQILNDYRTRLEKLRNVAEVLIRKNRHGPTANVNLHFNPRRTLFSDPNAVLRDERAYEPEPF